MVHTIRMTKHVSKFLAIAGLSVLALLVVAVLPLFAHAQRLPQSQTEIDLSFAPLVREASPAVVNVFTERMVANRVSPMEQLFFGDAIPKQRRQNSLGSGVIVGSDGVIVTNNHVIDGADTFRVVLSDRREYPAELVLADERTDLAVLKIDTEGAVLPTLPYADTRAAQVGDLVLAIGNPFGVGQTVTSGIISATARTDVGISDYAFFLQTDAAVNPGNSGGALVNTKGELVGVNTAIFSRSGGSNGIGFAIPAEMVKRVVDAGMNEGTFVRPWLGLAAQSVSYDIAKAQGLDRPVGVMVTEVYDDGPADNSGLRRGDLVTAIDGREVFDEKHRSHGRAATRRSRSGYCTSRWTNGFFGCASCRAVSPARRGERARPVPEGIRNLCAFSDAAFDCPEFLPTRGYRPLGEWCANKDRRRAQICARKGCEQLGY